jgi:hypothetical protein
VTSHSVKLHSPQGMELLALVIWESGRLEHLAPPFGE